ncbi:hypothetical protein NKJ51_23845 [Mesorhizobium sp. M0134]|uniref:hypothetical protein n=1 Tax=Mesorhizobium sp. M0134 TaxID=2956889 RepID=UPI003335EB13
MAEFSVNLGGGLYMDSNGVLSHGPVQGKPVYGTPGGGLPVNFDTLAKTFSGLAKALPNKDDPKSREKFDKVLNGIGMLSEDKENLINALQAIGAVASVIGSVVPVVGAALAVLTLLLGLFKDGPSPFEVLINRRFDDLARLITALETQITQRDLRGQRSLISAALAAFANYVPELKNTPPDASVLRLRQQDMRAHADSAGIAVRNLLDASTWLASFTPNDYYAVWPFLQSRLHTFPRTGAPVAALVPAPGANVFNHALMVPLSTFAVTSYLTVLRGLAPEFRSTREHREDLWDFAAALEVLAENMRAEGLSRTLYTTADFQHGAAGGIPWGIGPEEVIDLSALGVPPFLKAGSTRFSVGAMDLRVYNDTYFTPGFSGGSIQLPGDEYAKQGLLNVRWIPPAKLESYQEPIASLGWEPPNQPAATHTRYRITNPEACATAANAQAELDYADLLYSSGYLNLVHLVAVLRNEATDPSTSQTVRADPLLQRKPGTGVPVTVESEPILMTGVISSPAQREPQEYKATVSLTTQPLGRDRKLNYKVWLRTLPVSFSPNGTRWNEQDYGIFHQTDYVDDAAHPGCKTLVTSTGLPLDQLLISEGVSIASPRNASGTAALQAITHDWWVPLKPLGRPIVDRIGAKNLVSLRGLGWESGASSATAPASLPSGPQPSPSPALHPLHDNISLHDQISFSDLLGWIDSVEPATGQHRKAAQNLIYLDYTLDWEADQMTVTLRNHPADRNYVVYVVVEETLGSGQVLHTAQRIPVIGQLTYVPQTFFDQEAAAIALLNKTMRDFADHYAHSVGDVPGRPHPPGDPISGLLGLSYEQIATDPVLREFALSDFTSFESLERFAAQAAHHPSAAAILRRSLKEARIPESTIESVLRTGRARS